MKYRRLGRSGVQVSEVGLGSWLTYGGSLGDKVAHACIKKAHDLGINFFDTADGYAQGEAEKVVGAALKPYRRESFVLATKVYFAMGDGPNDRGLSRKHIMEQCNQSLKRMNVDYIDLYQCHRYDENVPLEETLRALDDLVTQGKVIYAGISRWTVPQIRDALGIADRLGLDRIVSNQPVYNMLARGIEEEIIPYCEEEGIGQVVYSPLAQGILTGKYQPGQAPPSGSRAADPKLSGLVSDADRLEQVQKLKPIAQAAGLSLARMALAWCLREPNVASVIIGASRPEQVEDNAGAAGIVLSAETLREIDVVMGA